MDRYDVYLRTSARTLDMPDEYCFTVRAINLTDAEVKAYRQLKKTLTIDYDHFYCVRREDI